MNGRPAMDTDGSGDASFEEWLASTWSPGGATTLPARSPGAPHHFTDTCPFCHLFERVWPDAAPRLACLHACAHTFRTEEENDAEMGACACACVCVRWDDVGDSAGHCRPMRPGNSAEIVILTAAAAAAAALSVDW